MGIEIERKFLVKKELWEKLPKHDQKNYRQGYLVNKDDRVVRIRIAGDQGYITIKGVASGISRLEFEYPIPKSEAEEILAHFKPEGTEKTRYRIPAGNNLTWEVDVFSGANQGLIVAEIELLSEDQTVNLPDWIDIEVTDDERYSNSSLALHPYTTW